MQRPTRQATLVMALVTLHVSLLLSSVAAFTCTTSHQLQASLRTSTTTHQLQASLRMSSSTSTSSTSVADIKTELLLQLKNTSPSKLSVYRILDRLCSASSSAPSPPTPSPAQGDPFVGAWSLIYTDDDMTRASPFFWAFRKAFGDKRVDFGGSKTSFSEAVFSITDTIPSSLKKIGSVRQFVEQDGRFISQIEIISPIGSSFMTTSSRWSRPASSSSSSSASGADIELRVEKTQVLDSTIQRLLNVPNDNPLLMAGFPSGPALELVAPGSSTVTMSNLYLDGDLRVSRNEEDKVFVFERASSSERPVGL